MADQSQSERFRKQLADHYTFPTSYLFKFIVPVGEKDRFIGLFPEINFDIKNSKNGKYVSFSTKIIVNSSEEVIDIYTKAYTINGIISL